MAFLETTQKRGYDVGVLDRVRADFRKASDKGGVEFVRGDVANKEGCLKSNQRIGPRLASRRNRRVSDASLQRIQDKLHRNSSNAEVHR